MVRAALALYQPPVADEPPTLVKFASPAGSSVDPIDRLRARFNVARKLLAAGDLISAGAVLRTVIEQRLRMIVADVGATAKTPGAHALFTVCVSNGVFGSLDRKLIPAALDIANAGAHGTDEAEVDHVVALAAVARRLINFRPVITPKAFKPAPSGNGGAA